MNNKLLFYVLSTSEELLYAFWLCFLLLREKYKPFSYFFEKFHFNEKRNRLGMGELLHELKLNLVFNGNTNVLEQLLSYVKIGMH